jgi:hypothetical protein
LEQYLRQGRDFEIDNGQTRYVAGAVREDRRFLPCTARTLETAILHVREDFAVVGVAERIYPFLVLLERTFGREPLLYVRLNTSPDRPHQQDVPQHLLELIEERNAYDRALHSAARSLLEERIASQGLTDEVERFARAHAAWQRTSGQA